MVILVNHPPPTEGLHHVEQNVTAFYKDKNLGKGTLYISESVVSWVTPTGEGFSLPYVSIFIHAICKDLSHFPHECIYLNVDGALNIGEEEEQNEISGALSNLTVGDGGTGDVDPDDEDVEPAAEMRFVPDNKEMLDVIFQSISDCQALNPDPEQEEDHPEGGDMFPTTFNFQYATNGTLEEFEADGGEDEEEMAEEQFEDADM